MRTLTALLIALAVPAAAQDRMTLSLCQDTLRAVGTFLPDTAEDTARLVQAVRVTTDNYCLLRGNDFGADAEFNDLSWRTDDTTRWTEDGIAPLALHLRLRGMDPDDIQDSGPTNRPHIDFEATLRQDPDAGLLVLEQAIATNGAGDVLSFSGVFERVFLSSASMMQVSVGSATFKAGLMSMTLDGRYENPFAFKFDVDVQGAPQAQRDAAFDGISRLPDGVIDDASRAELTAYAGDLPRPVGTLELSVASERGLGLMQIGMSAYRSIDSAMSGEQTADDMDIFFDGITITADWSPAAQVAD